MATLSMKLKPFLVPEHVIIELPTSGLRQDGMQPLPKIALRDLDEATLAALIDEFANSVMEAAGKTA